MKIDELHNGLPGFVRESYMWTHFKDPTRASLRAGANRGTGRKWPGRVALQNNLKSKGYRK